MVREIVTDAFGAIAGKRQAKPLASFKVILPLRGFAIFFVVLAHASIMLLADDVSRPDSLSVSLLAVGPWQILSAAKSIILEICRFSVPLFLFLSGYYLLSTPRTWKSIWSASKKLLLPMLFWSMVGLLFSWRKGFGGWTAADFALKLLTGTGQMGYFFIVLIVQYYVLSYFLIPAVESRPFITLSATMAIQLLVHAYDYRYLIASIGSLPALPGIWGMGPVPEVLFPRFLFSFTLGIWAATHSDSFRRLLIERYRAIVALSALSLFLMLLERGLLCGYGLRTMGLGNFEATSLSWAEWKIGTFAWTIAAIFLFFGFFLRRIPLKTQLDTLGKYSLQIFLLHGAALTVVHRLLYKIFGLNHIVGPVGVIALLVSGLILPILFSKIVQKTLPPGLRLLLLGS